MLSITSQRTHFAISLLSCLLDGSTHWFVIVILLEKKSSRRDGQLDTIRYFPVLGFAATPCTCFLHILARLACQHWPGVGLTADGCFWILQSALRSDGQLFRGRAIDRNQLFVRVRRVV